MEFLTDKQTLEDLNILGKFKQGSLYNLFNCAQTRGGELLLESMFRAPLSAAVKINERSACIEYLMKLSIQWSISREHAELATHFLSNGQSTSEFSSVLVCYAEKVQEIMYKSAKYVNRQKSIFAIQELLLAASNLLGQLRKAGAEKNPCKQMQERLESIVNNPVLKKLRPKFPYTISQTIECQFVYGRKCRDDIESLVKLIYEFDVYLSVADVARRKKLAFARAFDESDQKPLLEAVDLRHPSLSHAIGNTLTLSRDSNMVFLTGANMAGKSTWMKTLGVSYYLSHMGFPVAAGSFRFTVMEGIYTSINVPDDIGLGWSHFYAEVMRVKTVAQELSSGRRLFILFDELFKGTNVKDAFDATLAVSRRLALYRRCAFVISTHIVEVGYELKTNGNIQFRFMPTVMEGGVPRYSYRMAEGVSTDRQGMVIIENEKILEMLG